MKESTKNLAAEMLALKDWYHKIDLGDGLVTPGRDYEPIWNICQATIEQIDFRGKRVLDIGSCDGKWAFEAERRGAALVVATDLFEYALERFLFCKKVLKSNVIPLYNVSVYDLSSSLGRILHATRPPFSAYSQKFDVVLFFGVLYHLRDPLLALSQLRSVIKDDGVVALETAIAHAEAGPVMLFSGGEKMRLYPDVGNWWAPSRTCLREMCESSLLRPRSSSENWVAQNPVMGRMGLLLDPAKAEDIGHALAYELTMHYAGSKANI